MKLRLQLFHDKLEGNFPFETWRNEIVVWSLEYKLLPAVAWNDCRLLFQRLSHNIGNPKE